MGNPDESRCVGVIGDGSTDREVVGRIAEVLLEDTCVVHELRRQSIRDGIDKFWKDARSADGCGFPGEPADSLSRVVVSVLRAAFADLGRHVPRSLCQKDIIVLCSDAERELTAANRYFENWAWALSMTIQHGVERFHSAVSTEGHQSRHVPTVISMLPFPSTDVLVAACKGTKRIRAKKARALKQELYGTENLNQLGANEFEKKALNHVTKDNLAQAYQHLPEVRSLLRILLLARCA